MKRGLKVERRRKKSEKSREKNFNLFLFMRFYLERRNVTNKKGVFYANFFEFEEFSIVSFFVVAFSLSILYVRRRKKSPENLRSTVIVVRYNNSVLSYSGQVPRRAS